MSDFNPAVFALWIVPFLLAVVFHEWAHGYVAKRLGDDTASILGRLTLNPIAHIDPVGTLAVPAFLMLTNAPIMFGWAKPVPVSYERLRNPRRDMVLVALAGPAMNLILATISAFALATLAGLVSAVPEAESGGFRIAEPLYEMARISVMFNVFLAVFNLLPIPPLDGGRVAVGMLPPRVGWRLAEIEPYGFLIVLFLLMTHVLDFVLFPVTAAVLRILNGLVA